MRQDTPISNRAATVCAMLPWLVVTAFVSVCTGQETPGGTAVAEFRTLEEVVVTATRRRASVMDVPFSVNVKTEEEIQRLNVLNMEDLSRNVAGLSVQNLGPGQSVVTIRGISSGQVVRDQPGIKEQVGIYLDDTPISLSLFTPDLDFYDLNRVETLRGPQGTLFGSGSIGGTIRYITNQPRLNVARARAEFNLNTIDGGSSGGYVKTAFNVPMGDKMAARIVGYHTRYGGFIDALRDTDAGAVDDDVNDGARHGGRVAVTWKPTATLSVMPRVVWQKIDLNGFNRDEFFNLFANPHATTRRPVQLGERQQFLLLNEAFEDTTLLVDNVIKWNLKNLFEATYVASYIRRDLLVSRDASALSGSVGVTFKGLNDAGVLPPGHLITGFQPGSDLARVVSLPSNLIDTTDAKQMVHEMRLSSNTDGALQWQAGVFYSKITREYSQRLPTPGYDRYYDAGILMSTLNGFAVTDSPYNSDLTYDLRQVAVFGEATWTLVDRLGLTAGVRWYDWEEDKTFRSGGVFSNTDAQNQDATVSSDGLSPRFLINYDVTDHVAVNAQASRGFRLGGVNDPLNQPLCGGSYETFRTYQTFQDETLWNYEIGVKSSFAHATLNGSVFYADIENLGVNVDAGSCSSRVVVSVPDAHTMGVELEVSVQPLSALLVTAAGSFVEAEFDSTIINSADGAVVAGIRDGNRIPSVPNWQFSVLATYKFPGVLRARESYVSASWQFVGDRITQSGDQDATPFPAGASFVDPDGTTRDDLNFRDALTLDAYHLFNLNTGLVYDRWEFVFYVKNLADENPQLSFNRERGGRARLAYFVGQPRTFGWLARVNF